MPVSKDAPAFRRGEHVTLKSILLPLARVMFVAAIFGLIIGVAILAQYR